jgi:hypothetical protein
MPDVSVVVPVKDERDNVRPLIGRLRHALDAAGLDWEAVVIDDGSRDGTYLALDTLADDEPRLRVLRLWRNVGQSAALQAGFDHAAGRVIVTMDGDLQNDPADIPRLVRAVDDGYDVALGRRDRRHDKLLARKVPSWAANWLIRRATGVPFRDFGCTLRAMRREVVDGLTLYGERHRFLTAFVVQQGASVVQVPVRHHPRTAGRSKYGLTRTVRVLLDLLTVQFLDRFSARPMHAFGLLGLLVGGGGCLCLAAALAMKFTTGPGVTANPLSVAGGLGVIAGGQFLSLGLLGEVLARVYFDGLRQAPYRVREGRNLHHRPAAYSRAGSPSVP